MDKLMPLLQQLADKLGVAVEELFGALVHQASIAAGMYKMYLALSLFFGLLMGAVMVFCIVAENKSEDGEGVGYVLGFVFFILFGICVGVVIHCTYLVNTALNNPKFWAISEIVKKIQ